MRSLVDSSTTVEVKSPYWAVSEQDQRALFRPPSFIRSTSIFSSWHTSK